MHQFYCLMNSGPGLTDFVRHMLFDSAQEMLRNNAKRKLIKGKNFEARITTKMVRGSLGPISGYLFYASLERDTGTNNNISFLVRAADVADLEGGHWVTVCTRGFASNN